MVISGSNKTMADPIKKFKYQGHHQLTMEISYHVSILSSHPWLIEGDHGFDLDLEGYFRVKVISESSRFFQLEILYLSLLK